MVSVIDGSNAVAELNRLMYIAVTGSAGYDVLL